MIKLFDQIDNNQFIDHNRLVRAKAPLSFIAWKQANPKLPSCGQCDCPQACHRADTDNDWINWCGLCGGVCGAKTPFPWTEVCAKFNHPEEEPFGYLPGEQDKVWDYNYGQVQRPVSDVVRNTTEYAHMSGTNPPAVIAPPPILPLDNTDWMGGWFGAF